MYSFDGQFIKILKYQLLVIL